MGGSVGAPRVCAECSADLSEAPDRKGTQLQDMVLEGKYKLTDFIGEGAMGWVYRGVHLALDSSVAVKLMKPSGAEDDINDQRFAQEARAASRLNSPHVISIMDFGRSPGGLLFIVSEYLRGTTLTDQIAVEGAIEPRRALRIADQVLTGLEEAHDSGLIHRDLKPDNVMITPLRSGEEFVKLLDFGIAKLTDNTRESRLTQQGQVIGTPTYMAPEQIRGQETTARTDIYALGAILFEMLTGRPPFDSEAVMEVLGMHLSSAVPSMQDVAPERDIPPELEAVIRRALRKAPEERFGSVNELQQALSLIATSLARSQSACPTCGNAIGEGARFCEHCGTSLEESSPSTAPTRTTSPAPQPTAGPERATADTLYRADVPEGRVSGTGQTQWAGSQDSLPALDEIGDIDDTEDPEAPVPTSTLDRRLRAERTHRFQLTGRDQELSELRAFLSDERVGLELLGPLGSGRTRLLHEARQIAEEQGLDTLWMEPDPTLCRRPWQPVRETVARLLGVDSEPSRGALEDALPRGGLAPEDLRGLAELFGVQGDEEYVEHAVRLRETRAASLRAVVAQRATDAPPLVLLVDDADELDGASRTWLAALVSSYGSPRLKVITASEQAVLPAEPAPTRVEPRPLTELEISSLLDALPGEPTQSFTGRTRAIVTYSGGNVLHITQALRLLAEGGTEVDAPLGDIIQTRIRRLPTEALRLLQTICVLGRATSNEQLAAHLSEPFERYQTAVRLLIKRGLLEQPQPDALRVGHPRLGQAVRELLPADARRQLHQEILAQLEAEQAPPVVLARHAVEARLGERALKILRDAGLRAEQMLDDAGAALHFQRALHVARWELLTDESDETCLDLTLRLGHALRYSGDHRGATMVLQEGVQAARQDPGWHARMLHGLALVQLSVGQPTQALETMQGAVREAFFSGQPPLLNQIYMDLGKVLHVAGQDQRAVDELSEGVLMVTAGDGADSERTPDAFWRLLIQLSELQFRTGRPQEALKYARAALTQAERHQSRIGQARCHFMLGRCHDRQGHLDDAEHHHREALAAFRQLGDRLSTAEVLLADASREAVHRPDERERLRQQARTLSAQINGSAGAESDVDLDVS
jgi:serine/threonine-protein kinase